MVVRRALVLTLYVCALSPAHAHRVPECHTTVQVTGESLEIVHRLHQPVDYLVLNLKSL